MKPVFAVLLIFIILAGIVCMKIEANSAYFLTPDSHYYLQAAHNLMSGKGYQIWFEGKQTFCAIWPVGYAASIALTASILPVSLPIASKIVNLLALAGCFFILWQYFGKRAWFISLAFAASSVVQLYANTWSEPLFILFLVGFSLTLYKSLYAKNDFYLLLVVWAICALVTRYAGIFLFIPLLFYKRWREAIIFGVLVSAYLLYNYYQTGTFTGGHGFAPAETFITRFERGIKGIAEEFLLWGMRDWDLKNITITSITKWSIYGVAAIQLLVLGWSGWEVVKAINLKNWHKWLYTSSGVLAVVGGSYFVFMGGIYLTDNSIESLYFRRLAPCTILLVLGVLQHITANDTLFNKLKYPFLAYFILSLFHALPKI